MGTSIYKQIYDAIENESLPEGFELPEEDTSSSLKWAPGAMDGVYMYHMAPREVMTTSPAGGLRNALRAVCRFA